MKQISYLKKPCVAIYYLIVEIYVNALNEIYLFPSNLPVLILAKQFLKCFLLLLVNFVKIKLKSLKK